MSKHILPFLLLSVFSLFILGACDTTKKAAATQETKEAPKMADKDAAIPSEWDQSMEAYHSVMAGTFHPAEEGDFEPLKVQYKELASVAKKWAGLPVPEAQQGKGLEELLSKLAMDSKSIGKVVEGGNEAEMKKAIFGLHDIFHSVVGACHNH